LDVYFISLNFFIMKYALILMFMASLFLASCIQQTPSSQNTASPVEESMMQETEEEAMIQEDDSMVDIAPESPLENMEETMMEKEDTMEASEAMMEKEKEEPMMEKDDVTMQEKETTAMKAVGNYANYDQNLLGRYENTVLFFHATWCPSCRAADAALSGAEIPEGLSVLKLDFDTATDLRKKYGVTSQHTFVQVDAQGNLIKKWVGGNSVADIVEKI
jgi:thiol-disulfide isomerase/thioredoxin